MIASLIDKGNCYVCSNCMMKQKCLECACWFCGRTFSNYEDKLIEEFKKEYESNVHGESGKQTGTSP